MFVFNLIRLRKNRHCGPKRVLFVLILKRKIGDQNFPSICVPHFFWRPHFSICQLKKTFQSPVGACLEKLISDPETIAQKTTQSNCHSFLFSLSVSVHIVRNTPAFFAVKLYKTMKVSQWFSQTSSLYFARSRSLEVA